MVEIVQFRPVPSPHYKLTDECLRDHCEPVAAAAHEFLDDLRGPTERRYEQATWMGRGCSRQIQPGLFLVAKGVGPGPGSERMRVFLDAFFREYNDGNGACLRLDTGSYYPMLLQHSWKSGTVTVVDPRPEGMSIYGATLREFRSERYASSCGVDTVQSVALVRHSVTAPWVRDGSTVEEYLTAAVLADPRFHHGGGHEPKQVVVDQAEYPDMDAGLLIRAGRTPYRIQDLYQAALDADVESFGLLHSSASGFQNEPMSATLARTAASLFGARLLHGQLRTHFQNVSLAGELADFDSLVSIVPSQLAADLADLDDARNTVMAGFYHADRNRCIEQDSVRAAKELGQIYDLWNIALRLTDLLARDDARMQAAGTVLEPSVVRRTREEFAGVFRELVSDRDLDLLQQVHSAGAGASLRDYFDKRGDVSIYGWHRPGLAMNHFNRRHGDDDHAFVVDDAASLFDRLLRRGAVS